MTDNKFDVIIIGAGASGLMCAVALYIENPMLKVLVMDKNNKPGRKLLATGNGRCNFTNLNVSSDFYNTDDKKKLIKILHTYKPQKIIDYFEKKLGVIASAKGDLIYPITYQSRTVADALSASSKSARFLYNTRLESVVKKGMGYIVNGIYEADNIVFACGGVSYSDTGSDGSVYPVIRQLAGAESFERLLPSLVPLKTSDKDLKKLSGIRQECIVSMAGKSEKGEIQFTDYGVSGICIMQLSGVYNREAALGKPVKYLSVDLIPSMDKKTKEKYVSNLLEAFPDKTPVEALSGLLKSPLASVVYERSDKTAAGISGIIGDFRVNLSGSLGFEHAQVTSGGVKLKYLNDSLEMLNCKGAFVIGEACNVDGVCGGFNLHWAWASALTAAAAINEDQEGV